MFRGFWGISAGLLVWVLLWGAFGLLLPFFPPKQFNANGTTDSLAVNLIIILLSFDFSFISGYINAIIAQTHQLRCAAIQGIIQMGIGVNIQHQYSTVVSVWFHLIFLILIFIGVIVGVVYRITSLDEETP